MSKNDLPTRTLAQIRRDLDEAVDHLDAATLAELARARRRALGAAQRPRWNWTQQGIPAGAIAAFMAAAIGMGMWQSAPDEGVAPAQDIELLSSSESLDLFEQLEFYQWLPDEENAG
ncbi:MAG: hypothetical protein DRQ37_01865 [Gammaproteobacteria bacterium]|nr:MAG: hypothetical protein DRQ37_01865 [Gammaproteobacteria bacterium]